MTTDDIDRDPARSMLLPRSDLASCLGRRRDEEPLAGGIRARIRHVDPGAMSTRSFGEFLAAAPTRSDVIPSVYVLLGLLVPRGEDPIHTDARIRPGPKRPHSPRWLP
jgi:hypothetical protein